jgi:hypothetical protein
MEITPKYTITIINTLSMSLKGLSMYTSFQKYQFLTCSTTCTGKITEISSLTGKNHPSKTTHVLVFFGGHFSSLVKILLKQFKMAEIIASYASFNISARYTRTMIYIASYALFDISVRYTRTMIYIASYAPCPGVPN